MIVLLFAAVVADLPLTPDGWGAAKIGMTQAEVARALGRKLEGEPIEDENVCVEKIISGREGMWLMFEEGRLTRISIGEKSRITTPRRIGLGATAASVRKAYGKGLEAEPHHYVGLPAQYLTYWTVRNKRGVRFETDRKRRVETIHAGGPSIQYVEGCA
jgi:hypothetical protein